MNKKTVLSFVLSLALGASLFAMPAFADGTVLAAGFDEGYGNYLVLGHGEGWRSLYAHCSAVSVAAGAWVQRGQVIGQVGATGKVTGPHLHFELMQRGVYRNPEYYING